VYPHLQVVGLWWSLLQHGFVVSRFQTSIIVYGSFAMVGSAYFINWKTIRIIVPVVLLGFVPVAWVICQSNGLLLMLAYCIKLLTF